MSRKLQELHILAEQIEHALTITGQKLPNDTRILQSPLNAAASQLREALALLDRLIGVESRIEYRNRSQETDRPPSA